MRLLSIMFLAILLLAPVFCFADDDEEWLPLKEGSVSFRIGQFFPRGDSDLWQENVETFTYEVADFNNYIVGAELNWFLNRYLTVGLAMDFYTQSSSPEYRLYVDEEGMSIGQKITLIIVPITATMKLTPFGNGAPGYGGERGSAIVPWIGAGIGVYTYSYEETGMFIDFSDMSIFDATFSTEEEAAGFGFHLAAGLVLPIELDWDIFGEVRYTWAEGDLGQDFTGFEPLDLGGSSFCFGFSYRF